jgi:4-diphosphocytidyl-2-C-methyl-D-erythritol kinase
MDCIKLKARAKINITLDVLSDRADGYHELQMIMQTVNLCDNLFIKKSDTEGITLTSNLSWLPCDERNLIYRAAKLLAERYSIKSGIYIELNKTIPVAAGLAGGSTDAAATLVGIRSLFNLKISDTELMAIGKELGADVPYCIKRGTALAEGIGEKLTELPPFPDCYVLLAKPPINVSTAAVFKAFDESVVSNRPDNKKVIECIKQNDLKAVCDQMCNVLETVTIKDYPVIAEIKQAMLENKAVGSMMSGSGPTVFGFFTNYDDGIEALRYIRQKFHLKEIYLTTVFNTTGRNDRGE